MTDTTIQSILTEKKPCYFISPHFDDAIFSAGALIQYLSKETNITIINVFTKANTLTTLSAIMYLRQCGYTNALQLFADREQEDKRVFTGIAKHVINLGFTDALWRKKYTKSSFSQFFPFFAELQVIYPTYKFHVSKGIIAKEDKQTQTAIATKLRELIVDPNAVIFCPFGFGNHVDHVITRKASEDTFPQLIYWADFPYSNALEKDIQGFRSFSFDKDLEKKEEVMREYETQYPAVFRKGLIRKPEQYFIKI